MIQNPAIAGKSLPDIANPGTAADLLTGKQLIGPDGEAISGSMPSVAQATPSITVSSGGLITAKADQSGGKVDAGSRSATKQLTTQGGKTVTPGTSQQTAVYSGRYTTGNVYVAGDPDLKPENIKSGVNIFGVAGTLKGFPDSLMSARVSATPLADNSTIKFALSSDISGTIDSHGPKAMHFTLSRRCNLTDFPENTLISCSFFVWKTETKDFVCRAMYALYLNDPNTSNVSVVNGPRDSDLTAMFSVNPSTGESEVTVVSSSKHYVFPSNATYGLVTSNY